MKKITFLMMVAGLAVSATAINKKAEVIQRSNSVPVSDLRQLNLSNKFVMPAKELDDLKTTAVKKGLAKINEFYPDSIYPYFRPQDNYMSIGVLPDGRYYPGIGFASIYGELGYYNFTYGAESTKWYYSDFNDIVDGMWVEKESSDFDFIIKPQIGGCMGPYLEAFNGDMSALYENVAEAVYFGGSPGYYGLRDEEGNSASITFYPNFGLMTPDEKDGTLDVKLAYGIEKRPQLFTKYGAYTGWVSELQNEEGIGIDVIEHEGEEKNDTVYHEIKNVGVSNFVLKLPAPESTYTFSSALGLISVNAEADTELISYIYPMDADGNFSEETPIAMGSTSVQSGNNFLLTFQYLKIDEDGDPVEGDIYIDGPIALTIEGFAGNSAITQVAPYCGYAGPFNVNAARAANRAGELQAFMPTPQLYVTLTFDRDGEAQTLTTYDAGWYYFDQRKIDEDDEESEMINPAAISPFYYAQFFLFAQFPFIISENGEKSVDFELTGGNADVTLESYYSNMKGLIDNYDEETGFGYVMTAPEWADVTVGETNNQTGETVLSVAVEATDTPRSGVITIDGMGATYSLMVNQGESGVSTISLEKGAEYYDLMGRKVANPEKGIYIKKHGKTSTKVIF